MKQFLLYLWQLPQNVIGWVLSLFAEHKINIGDVQVYTAKWMQGGISLGQYVLVKTFDATTVRHEYGHSIQSKKLGWFYLLVIGLPSIVHAVVWRCSKKRWNYYAFYTEKWADKLGKVER